MIPHPAPGKGRRMWARSRGVSWLEPAAKRYRIVLHKGSSLQDRNNNTRFGWRKADCSHNSPNPDSCPNDKDTDSKSTPTRHPITSPTVRCATPRNYGGTRRHETRRRKIHPRETCQTRRHETRQIRPRRGNPCLRLRHEELRGRDLNGRAQQGTAEQLALLTALPILGRARFSLNSPMSDFM